MDNAAEPGLPIEIFGVIFENLYNSLNSKDFFRTISRCCQVSRLFNEICSPFFFRNGVQLGPTTSDRRRISHSRASALLERFPSADVYVQRVAYNFDFRQPKDSDKHDLPWPSAPSFASLPNISSISIRCDGRHSLSQGTAGDDEREIFPVDLRGYRLLFERSTSAQTVSNITFGHIRQIPVELILSLPKLKVLSLHFCSLLDSPSLASSVHVSPLSTFVATYTNFDPSFFRHCPNLEKIDVQGANPSSNRQNPLTSSVVDHDFCNLKEIVTDCTLQWSRILPSDPSPTLFSAVKKVHIQLDDDGAIELISSLLDRVSVVEDLSIDMDLVRDTAIDLTKRMKAWRESLKKLTFIWYKNKEAHLEILCNALDLQGTACRKPSALEALELRTSIDLINPDNMFDHDTLQWRRLDHLLLGHLESYSSLRSLDLHININRICREIRKEFTSATGRGWIAQYVDDWLEQVPLKNILGPSRVEFRTQVSSFALMFPGRDGEE
ncbi:hypothetical protein BJ165DRAFT_1468159 [Panaeolus papilionaceus]|nr:hypothetical protein BJ165DRAFT_1468159 [Panaeolus papilionaceus]